MSVGDGYLPLNRAAKQRFVKWLNSRTNEHNCPVCQKNDWSVGDYFMHGVLFSLRQPPAMAGGSAYPIVFLVCNHCAYIRQFMAIQAGIFPSDLAVIPPSSDGPDTRSGKQGWQAK